MMNLDNYYIHATGGFRGITNNENKILNILEDGKIKTDGRVKSDEKSPDHLTCLCDTTRPWIRVGIYSLFSSFEEFVLYSPSLVLSRDFEVIIPKYGTEPTEEIADMYDEVRCDKEISLEHLKFITFPLFPENRARALSNEEKLTDLQNFKENISVISREFKTIPVKNIYTGKDITTDDVDRQIEIYEKKLR